MVLKSWGVCPDCQHQNEDKQRGRFATTDLHSDGTIIESWRCSNCDVTFQRKHRITASELVLEVFYDDSGEHITIDKRTDKPAQAEVE